MAELGREGACNDPRHEKQPSVSSKSHSAKGRGIHLALLCGTFVTLEPGPRPASLLPSVAAASAAGPAGPTGALSGGKELAPSPGTLLCSALQLVPIQAGVYLTSPEDKKP